MIYDELAMNNGVIFRHAYDILNEKMQQGITNMVKGDNGRAVLDASLFVTAVTNCAFACELFIKSMLPKDTKGHKLDKLFALLDNDIQIRIKAITVEEMKKTKETYCDLDFKNDLIKNGNLFSQWRYFHEKGNGCTVNLKFISVFMEAVFNIANEEKIMFSC